MYYTEFVSLQHGKAIAQTSKNFHMHHLQWWEKCPITSYYCVSQAFSTCRDKILTETIMLFSIMIISYLP